MRYYIISYKKRPLGESGESCRSDYDLSSACIDCGTGAKVVGSLKVKRLSSIKEDLFETLDGDFLISKKLYNRIRDSFNYFELKQVIDLRNNYLDYYHFVSNVTLPRFKNDSSGFVTDRQCLTCKRNGYFSDTMIGDFKKNTPTIIQPYTFKYDKTDLDITKNELILNTWECFGLSNRIASDKYVIRYARPLTIVSGAIKDIFESQKIKGIEYEQIMIE